MTDSLIKRDRFPTWVKLIAASMFGAGGIGGATTVPVNFNAEIGYASVSEAYPGKEVMTRSWRPYSFAVKIDCGLVIVETSMFDGKITDRWVLPDISCEDVE